ncbi:metallophosphoesterase family protein [Bradyrhizobium sp. OK095]|jgi:putative phosphoesterase|uniref:metallophosphoesterase family protein n=1 Tax=Bradyrhizobium sp. OK095 TaxID=1882760 RepID=UPI0008CBF053|nr:metallophosphoesterase family protein [Bradyrhizobium sp. OK095]SEN15084.1 phosphoesterase, MJ0936 family [Bradyrhizobium sp. OK095]
MKIAFISDIHGNFEALTAVLAELDRMRVSEIFCVGDVVGYYSQVNECCDELRRREIKSVIGNHDWYLGFGGFCIRSKSVNECLVYQRKVISSENVNWLQAFRAQMQVGTIQVVHGGWSDPIDEYIITPNEEYFERLSGAYFVSGHTHVQSLHRFGEKTYCNPGSVGQPRDGDPRAAFATFDGESFELHRVEYNMQKVFELMEAAGFHDYYYGGLKTGAKNLRRLAD